jgi:MFS family permease
MKPSRRSLRGLDWFVFFVADVQTGFGPFVAVYLTAEKWTQVDIGLVLSMSGVVALLGQIPGGALLDWARRERLVAGIAVALISASAIAYAGWPILPVIFMAAILHAAASCVLGPAIAAISLGLVGPDKIGERLGRNARFASIGAGLSAGVMGACGYFFETRSVFIVTAALLIPTWWALRLIAPQEIDPEQAHGNVAAPRVTAPRSAKDPSSLSLRNLLSQPALLVFGISILLFHLANAAMLPLMGSVLTTRSSEWATVLIAACMVGPQLVVAAFSPWAGRLAERWGRRPILLAGLAALPVRGFLFATVSDPYVLVAIQLLDGITATVMSVMVPLTIADLTRGTGRFNLTQGLIGTMMGVGASLSPTLAGYVTDRFGSPAAFSALAAIATIGLVLVALWMPETRPHAAVHREPAHSPVP